MNKDKNISLRVNSSLYEYIQTSKEKYNMSQTEFIEYKILSKENSNIDFINEFILLINWYEQLRDSIDDMNSINLNINDGGIIIEDILDKFVRKDYAVDNKQGV